MFGLLAWLGFVASPFLAPSVGVRLLPVILFVPFIGAVVALTFFVRCPRCNGNLGLLIAQTYAPGRFRKAALNCPFCGVRFDDHP